jgi:hypothetical protein
VTKKQKKRTFEKRKTIFLIVFFNEDAEIRERFEYYFGKMNIFLINLHVHPEFMQKS